MLLTADTSGERLDAFLARSTPMSRAQAQKLLEAGLVKKNGLPGRKNDRLEAGDRFYPAGAGGAHGPAPGNGPGHRL